jgi:hypothetical protein
VGGNLLGDWLSLILVFEHIVVLRYVNVYVMIALDACKGKKGKRKKKGGAGWVG